MAKFTLEIRLGNDAMQSGEDLADALATVVRRLRDEGITMGNIFDANGNRVGKWSIDADS